MVINIGILNVDPSNTNAFSSLNQNHSAELKLFQLLTPDDQKYVIKALGDDYKLSHPI